MQAPAMKAVLLLLALCGLAAASATAPKAEDVRETGQVSPSDAAGERSDTRKLSSLRDRAAAEPVRYSVATSALG